MAFTLQQENAHLRQRCVKAERENAELRAGVGLDKFEEKCKKEAEERNIELGKQVREQERTISKLGKENDTLKGNLNKTNEALGTLRESVQEQKTTIDETVAINRKLRKDLTRKDQTIQKKDEKIQALKDDLKSTKEDLKSAKKEVKELNGKVKKLEDALGKANVLLGKNSGNSGIPSSRNRIGARVPVANSRTSTDRKPGAQPGHDGHKRTKLLHPDFGTILLYGQNDPLWHDPYYRFDGYAVKVVQTPVTVTVQEIYYVPQFRHVLTGAHKEAAHPDWLKDEVNHSPMGKAVAMYLNQVANISTGKCNDVFKAITNREYTISTGGINGLTEEFAIKTEKERKEIFSKLLGVHVMNVDGTVVNVGGKQYNIMIMVSGAYTMYMFRPVKGFAAVKGTPIELTTAILIHDHDVTYYNYGSDHQECLDHIERYLILVIQNEPDLTWAMEMLALVRKMRADAKKIDEERKQAQLTAATMAESTEAVADEDTEVPLVVSNDVNEVCPRFASTMFDSYKDDFVKYAFNGVTQYEEHPPKTWFRDGKNLCERMYKNPDDYLLFLQDDQVSCSNAAAELGARSIKRKLAACMEFRGFLGVIAYCEAKTCIETLLKSGADLLPGMAEVFSRDGEDTDKLNRLQTVVPLYGDAITSDKNAIAKYTKMVENDKTDLAEAQKQYEDCKAEYEKLRQKRMDSQMEEETEDEVKARNAVAHADHLRYTTERTVKDNEERLEKAKKHKEKMEREKEKIESDIKALSERIKKASESSSNSQETREVVLADIMTPEIQDAMSKVEECKAECDRVNGEWAMLTSQLGNAALKANVVTQVIDEKTGKVSFRYGSDKKFDKLVQETKMNEKYAEVNKAIEALVEAQKTLDALIKNRKRHHYKKNRKKAVRKPKEQAAETTATEELSA